MAISLLQDAQQRSLAAALAGIKREDHSVDRSLSLSPPMSANTSVASATSNSDHHSAVNMYPGLQQDQASASLFNMLAANRQAAAAFMAAQIPIFPHHQALFGSWANAAAAAVSMSSPHMPLSSGPHSPPTSPHSPLSSTPVNAANGALGKHSLASIISTKLHSEQTPQLLPVKKSRKQLSVKKDLISASSSAMSPTSSPIEISMSVADLYQQPHHHHTPSGPISPPSSGSSPNSTHEGHNIATGGVVGVSTPKDPSRDKSFTCKICSRSFGYKHVLQNHERTHTGEKPFECPECHKRFTRDHHLKTHMRLHTGEKPYSCSHCDRHFVQVANLRRHLRVHTGERPYTCQICEGKFSDSNQLKSHMLVHNGEKPFECEHCNAKFRRRHHLMNHKCGGLNSPPATLLPTPAISPAMSSDYVSMMCDQKSTMGSSYGSEESIDLGKPVPIYDAQASLINEAHESPLDLSEENAILDARTSRKPMDIRRVFRLPPPQIQNIFMPEMPEQTEPEDLSIRSPRSSNDHALTHSDSHESALHDDIDLDDLDDAATFHMRQQQLAAMKRICEA